MNDDLSLVRPLASDQKENLFRINETLAELLAVRADMLASDPVEDISAIDGEIIKYFQKEVAKADAIIPLWRHFETTAATARAEAARLKAYAEDLEGQLEHMKLRVKEVMVQFDKKVIPGSTGRLMLKGNGGSAPIQIQEEMLPDELCKWEGTIYGHEWSMAPDHWKQRPGVKMKRLPSNTKIREALAKPCETCGGTKTQLAREGNGEEPCQACGGTGKAGVPGARLLERGKHVEVK